MPSLFHISRNYVEFGAFTAEEVKSFHQRGILRDHDYVREEEAEHWLPVTTWLESSAEKPAAKTKVARKRSTTAKTPKKAA